MLTAYLIVTAVEVVSTKKSLIKLEFTLKADWPRIAGLDQFQVLIVIGDAAVKLILLPQPTELVFQLPAPVLFDILGMGNTITVIIVVTLGIWLSVTLYVIVPFAVPVQLKVCLMVVVGALGAAFAN
jgi:hypothetical protein